MDGISLLIRGVRARATALIRLASSSVSVALAVFAIAGASCGEDRSDVSFDGERAWRDLVLQCEFGPRVPGSEAHREMTSWLIRELEAAADEVTVDTFTVEDDGTMPEFRNIMARFRPEAASRILLCAHYDSRPIADRDPDPENRHRPIPGANDGASGVAVLVELARVFSAHPPALGIDLVFFDGEDYGETPDRMLIGSRRFARENPEYRPLYGLLLDMVGDRDLRIHPELYSLRYGPEIVRRVWSVAEAVGWGEVFVQGPRHAVADDHLPLLQAGIRCIDIIDFDYPHWHTTEDTPDKCSAASLQAVGDVVLAVVSGEAR